MQGWVREARPSAKRPRQSFKIPRSNLDSLETAPDRSKSLLRAIKAPKNRPIQAPKDNTVTMD